MAEIHPFHSSSRRVMPALVGAAAALAACALVVRWKTRQAERAFRPQGRFVIVNGVRLHYLQHGADDAEQTLVLLHGMGSLAEEMELSGLVQQAALRFRVIVFDRPGHGHSDRPPGDGLRPEAQADLIQAALAQLGVQRPVLLGHGFGALVALALGLRHPQSVSSLVLVSGCYFPSVRLDVPVLAMPALPLLGTLMRHTVGPLLGRLLWPLAVRRAFSPTRVTQAFKQRYPVWMSLRPSQLHASAAESAQMIPAARRLQLQYGELQVPAVVVAGAQDRQVSAIAQSRRLYRKVENGRLRLIHGAGHMVHHVAAGEVMAAVHKAAAMANRPPTKFSAQRRQQQGKRNLADA